MGKVYRYLYLTPSPWLGWRSYEKAGPWIREHSKSGDEVVAAEIGYVGYFSKRKVFDTMGLISPEALDRLTTGTLRPEAYLDPWDWALRRGSRFVVFPFENNAFTPLPKEFSRLYAIGTAFPNKDGSTTLVFVRDESTGEESDGPVDVSGGRIGVHPEQSPDAYSSWPPP
jgi:hypothetical protein